MKTSLLQSIDGGHLMINSGHASGLLPSPLLESLDRSGPGLDDEVSTASSIPTSGMQASSNMKTSTYPMGGPASGTPTSTDVNWLMKYTPPAKPGTKRTIPHHDNLSQSMTASFAGSGGGGPVPDVTTVVSWIRDVFDTPASTAITTSPTSLAERLSEFKLVGRIAPSSSAPEMKSMSAFPHSSGGGRFSRNGPLQRSTGSKMSDPMARSNWCQTEMLTSRDSTGSNTRRGRPTGHHKPQAWTSTLGAGPKEDPMGVSACCQTDLDATASSSLPNTIPGGVLTNTFAGFKLGQGMTRHDSPLRDIMELARQQEASLKAHMMQRDRSRSAGSRHSDGEPQQRQATGERRPYPVRRDRTLSRGRLSQEQQPQTTEGFYVNAPPTMPTSHSAATLQEPNPRNVQWTREQDARMRAVNAWLASPGVSNAPPPPAVATNLQLPAMMMNERGETVQNPFQRNGTFRKSQLSTNYPVPVIEGQQLQEEDTATIGRTFMRSATASALQQPSVGFSRKGQSSQLQQPGFYRRV